MDTPLSKFALLLFVATFTSVATRSRGWSNLLPLIGVGALLGLTPWAANATVPPAMAMAFLVVPLVFGDAIGSSLGELRRNALDVLLLALIPVATSTLAVGAVASWLVGMNGALACAIGAVLSPTDTVALASVTRSTPIPRQIGSIIEGEALLNDVSALTALHLSMAALLVGHISLGNVLLVFTESSLIGVGIGLLAGWLLARTLRFVGDDTAFNSLVMVVPFGVYAVSEHLGGSGILAIVCAALSIGLTQHRQTAYTGRHHFSTVWAHASFILQSLAFLLVGVELPKIILRLPAHELSLLGTLTLAILAVLIGVRFLTLFALRAGLMALRPRVHIPWQGVLLASWFGVRGPVSSMAALTIPLTLGSGAALPQRDLAIAAAFLVIVMTVILAYTLKPLIALLDLPEEDDPRRHELAVRERLMTLMLQRIDDWIGAIESGEGDPAELPLLRHAREEFGYRRRRYRDCLDDGASGDGPPGDTGTREPGQPYIMDILGSEVIIRLIQAQRELLTRRDWPETIPEEALGKVLRETDIQLQLLKDSMWARKAPNGAA